MLIQNFNELHECATPPTSYCEGCGTQLTNLRPLGYDSKTGSRIYEIDLDCGTKGCHMRARELRRREGSDF